MNFSECRTVLPRLNLQKRVVDLIYFYALLRRFNTSRWSECRNIIVSRNKRDHSARSAFFVCRKMKRLPSSALCVLRRTTANRSVRGAVISRSTQSGHAANGVANPNPAGAISRRPRKPYSPVARYRFKHSCCSSLTNREPQKTSTRST